MWVVAVVDPLTKPTGVLASHISEGDTHHELVPGVLEHDSEMRSGLVVVVEPTDTAISGIQNILRHKSHLTDGI